MTLKEANRITKEFSQYGTKITPQLSDDWTYSFDTNHNSDDKVVIHSEKLNLKVFISMDINSFFKKFIFNKKLLIDGNKLVGTFSFTKYNIYLEDEFLEAKRVEDESFQEVIPNDELIEFGLYLDDKGDKYVYLGNYEPRIYSFNNGNSNIYIQATSRKSARYIVKYNDEWIQYNNYMIQKNSTKKFIKLISVLNFEEKKKFKEKLLFNRLSGALSFGNKIGNKIEEFYENNRAIYYNCLIKHNDKDLYGYYSSEYSFRSGTTYYFYEFDFEKVKKDILSNKFRNFNDYIIEIHHNFKINSDDFSSVKLYVSYE